MAEGTKKPEFVWMDGKIIPYDQATIHVMSPAARYGTSVFEGLRAYWNEQKEELYAFRLGLHYQRLFESAKMMRLKVDYSKEDCERLFLELLRKNHFKENIHARHVIYVGGSGPYSAREPVGMFIVALARPSGKDVEKGIHCAVSSWFRIGDNSMPPRIKAGSNYQNGRLADLQAKEDGYDRSIMLNSNGKVSEGGGACLFMVRRGVVVTPPVTAGILESVTRATLIELFTEEMKLKVQERDIDRTELYVAEEAFFCGSGAEILPIISVDRLPVGAGIPGPITKAVQEAYFAVVRGQKARYMDWLSPAYKKP